MQLPFWVAAARKALLAYADGCVLRLTVAQAKRWPSLGFPLRTQDGPDEQVT